MATKTRQFVLFASDTADVEILLDTIISFEMDNTGKFIIICESSTINECNEQDVMVLCWNYRIVNVVFIRLEETQEAVGFTYYPVADGICSNLKPIKLNSNNQYVKTTHGEIFRKKFRNLNFCPIVASTFLQPPYMYINNGIPKGVDGDLLRMIIYGMNASLKMMTPHRGSGWGFREKNGTWMGSLADVYDDLANFSMTSGAITLTRFTDFQISSSYSTSKVVWVSETAQAQNVALKLMHPFEKNTRLVLITSFLLVVCCAFVMKSSCWTATCNKGIQTSKSIVFYAWMICMGQAVEKLPTKSAFVQMTLVWIWYCFLIRTAYQVYLISSLKGKFYESQFVTIEDAIIAQYPFGGGAALKDYYADYPFVYKNWVNIDTQQIAPTALNISKGMNFVLAMNIDAARSVIKTHKRLSNFRKCPLIMSTIEQPPFMYLHNLTSKATGIDGEIMELVADMLNATLHLKPPFDGGDSGHYANNNWTGSLAYLESLNTFQDVLKENYPYGGLDSLKEYYIDDQAIYEKWKVLELKNVDKTLDDILDGTTDFVLASNKEFIKHHIMKYNGTKQLQIIPEKIVNSPTVVYLKKFSPLVAPLNFALRIAFEAGFVQRTYERYLDHDKKLLQRLTSKQAEPLSMEHFTGCFVLLILGCLAKSLVAPAPSPARGSECGSIESLGP
uniref:Ionotropic glutamate receptor L-glutamate and glycine-binding domain-containing protein n=1 Tax=Heliothis virescens TaxID=7102 RepID=A0A2A4J050_HELVI